MVPFSFGTVFLGNFPTAKGTIRASEGTISARQDF